MSFANAPIVLNSRDRQQSTPANYNNAQFNAENQNIIQGDIREIAVSEVNFPYDIPNIQDGYNTFELVAYELTTGAPTVAGVGDVPGFLTITITPGFYTGSELATAINAAITTAQVGVEAPAGDAPTVAYNAVSNLFTFLKPANTPAGGNPTPNWIIASPYTFPLQYEAQTNTLGKDILSIMGFLPYQSIPNTANTVSSDPASDPPKPVFQAAESAPLVFTQYVDICSPQLCKFQYFRDGSTTNLARRADVICRLYISNNISIPEQPGAPDGTRPFIINRQYYNARVMRWSVENSVGTIDIQLYDDCGQPLTTTWQPRPYQITFNCYERSPEASKYDEGETGDISGKPARFAAYHEANVSRAWANLRRHQ